MVFVLIFVIIRIRIRYYSNNLSIRIRIRTKVALRIVFIFVFGQISEPEYYSYSYSAIFLNPNSIRIRIWSRKHYSLTSVASELHFAVYQSLISAWGWAPWWHQPATVLLISLSPPCFACLQSFFASVAQKILYISIALSSTPVLKSGEMP